MPQRPHAERQPQRDSDASDGSSESEWVSVPDVSPLIASLTLGIIARTAFPTLHESSGSGGGSGSLAPGGAFASFPAVLNQVIGAARGGLVFVPHWHLLPLRGLPRLRANIARLRAVAEDVISSARVRGEGWKVSLPAALISSNVPTDL
jgi:hypothetical protein